MAVPETTLKSFQNINRDRFDDFNPAPYMEGLQKGLSVELIHKISSDKGEPKWMLDKRLRALEIFYEKELPTWGADLSALNLDEITYYARPGEMKNATSWEDVPEDIKNTFEKLGIPEAEKHVLAGVGAQYESDNVYHRLRDEWTALGVIFEDMDAALEKHPDMVKEYFMTKCVPAKDHKFAALHGAVWSGGTFLYVPPGVEVTMPLQAYFRMNARGMGQFEHTLMVIDKGAKAHYIEGCSAPKYGTNALHAGCVEVFVKEGAQFRYSSVENWSKDTYNLNTKRAIVEKDGVMEWVGGNLGSGVTMLYPCSILKGDNSRADHLGVAFANAGQVQDTGSKVFHIGKNTSSTVIMKSLSKGGGKSVYRGLLHVAKGATGASSHVQCDALMLDSISSSDTIPDIRVSENDSTIGHEATVGKIGEEQVFYLMSRGITEREALAMIVNGFIEPIIKQLPLEYAVELNRLIELEMEGSIG